MNPTNEADEFWKKATMEVATKFGGSTSTPKRTGFKPGPVVPTVVPPDPAAAKAALAEFASVPPGGKSSVSPGGAPSFRSGGGIIPPRGVSGISRPGAPASINTSVMNSGIEQVTAQLQDIIRSDADPRRTASQWLTAITRAITDVIHDLDEQDDT